MRKYIVELWGCVEVEAEDKWEAMDKAWEAYDAGTVTITEANVLDSREVEDESE